MQAAFATVDSSLDQGTAGSSDSDASESTDSQSDPVITATSYSDANMQISIATVREYDTDIYIADVQVSSAAYLKCALAQNSYGRNLKQTTSSMASEHNAVLAVNGDYYGFRDDGFVVRNGVLYRDTAAADTDALVIDKDGSMYAAEQGSITAQSLVDDGAWQVLSFGPVLVSDNQVAVGENAEVGQAKTSNPRTAIGVIDSLHYVVVVSDGRTNESQGLSLYQLAQVMRDYGCSFAYNLDGGGSSTMVFNNEVVNNPTDGRSAGERSVSDIVYFG